RGYLQLLKRSQSADGDRSGDGYVSAALIQANRLDRLVAELLDATRLEHGRIELARASIDLTVVVRNVAETAQVLVGDQQIRVKAVAMPIIIEADEVRVEQALLNIVGNAIQHAADSPSIDVGLRRERDVAVVTVADRG